MGFGGVTCVLAWLSSVSYFRFSFFFRSLFYLFNFFFSVRHCVFLSFVVYMSGGFVCKGKYPYAATRSTSTRASCEPLSLLHSTAFQLTIVNNATGRPAHNAGDAS